MSEVKVGRKSYKVLFEDASCETHDLIKFHDVFVEQEDLTEYRAALILVGSWKEWESIKRNWPAFNSHIIMWKEEIVIRLRSQALEKLVTLAKGNSSQAASAAKWLAEEGWSKRAGKGRATKSETQRQSMEIAAAAAETKSEEERMLKVIDGGVTK